jgi:hypothetical protein
MAGDFRDEIATTHFPEEIRGFGKSEFLMRSVSACSADPFHDGGFRLGEEHRPVVR